MDSNSYSNDPYSHYEALIAIGAQKEIRLLETKGAFDALKAFQQQNPGWLFGYLSYDLKNDTEQLESRHPDRIGFPSLHFFQPQHLLLIKARELEIQSLGSPEKIWEEIWSTQEPSQAIPPTPPIQARIPRAEYLSKVEQIRQHILEGDVYEMNFCQEFYAEGAIFEPTSLFDKLNQLAKAPFSSFYRLDELFLLGSSPERFLQKRGDQLISQPIKGTIRRGTTPEEDWVLSQQLLHSKKDQAENIMIVDLVRNDLARSCQAGSVKIEELFSIYPFQNVFQMISTISGKIRPEVNGLDALRNAFPMGSMTGAPKVMSMQLIEQYEKSQRGLYSGAVGYIRPNGDYDFNVVIRSLLYNRNREYLSFQVGGAIVYDSVPELEYEECLVKAENLLRILGQSNVLTAKSSLDKSSQKAG